MIADAWLPVAYVASNGEKIKSIISAGSDWQIYQTEANGRLMLARENIALRWLSSGILLTEQLSLIRFGDESYYEVYSAESHTLSLVRDCKSPQSKSEALAFAVSLKATRGVDGTTSFHDAIYVEKFSRLLPTYTLSAAIEDDVILGSWLTGGIPISVNSFRRLSVSLSWLTSASLRDIVEAGGFRVDPKLVRANKQVVQQNVASDQSSDIEERAKKFSLAGRPELEQFFNEHVIDIIENEARYSALGIEFPSAVILHGPPGCGKTFAVERLVDYLGWPSFQIEASSVASPYIHETSKKVAEVFENAIKNAPSVLVIDEMEAFLADRGIGGGGSHHRVEEVAEFLRRIPEAIKNHVLILAMTNRIEMIDPAILRRGRFDHIIKIDMASQAEVEGLLQSLVSQLPCENDLDLKFVASHLNNRPLSDVAFVVREGARLAAKSGKDALDQTSLLNAVKDTCSRGDTDISRKIGFI